MPDLDNWIYLCSRMRGIVAIVLLVSLELGDTAEREQWDAYKSLANSYQEDPKLQSKWANHMKKFLIANLDYATSDGTINQNFPCVTNKSTEIPTSVDKLLPGDIKVIAALGDSISAGNGIIAETIIDTPLQQRSRVFSVGGERTYDDGVVTVPNMLKLYNGKLYGYSIGRGDFDSKEARLNAAVPGAKAPDLPEQADFLIQRMKADPNVDMKNDWKMVTIFIGGNDLCRVCVQDDLGPESFIQNMENTLNKLAVSLPRTIVNVIPIVDVTRLTELSFDEICDRFQANVCPCAADPEFHEEVKKAHREYSSYTATLIGDGRYDKRDFTVVFQPFLRDTVPPKNDDGENDFSFFSPDCFHFSEKGHQALARNLWNSLFIPVGRKPTSMNFRETISCPVKGAYIATNKNSKTGTAPEVFKTSANDNYLFVDVLAACSAPAAPSGGVRSLTTGLAVVGSICGILLAVVAALMVVVIRRRRAAEKPVIPIL